MPVTEYIWDDVNDCVLEETDELEATQVTYTHEPGSFGPLVSEYRGGTTYNHHYDALGSTTLLTDDTGAVTDTFQYDAWGNSVSRTGPTPTPYTWVGRWGYQDDSAITGGFYVRARSYQPISARWMSVDPLSTIAVAYMYYCYCNNNPTWLIDSTGTQPDDTNGTLCCFDQMCTVKIVDKPPSNSILTQIQNYFMTTYKRPFNLFTDIGTVQADATSGKFKFNPGHTWLAYGCPFNYEDFPQEYDLSVSAEDSFFGTDLSKPGDRIKIDAHSAPSEPPEAGNIYFCYYACPETAHKVYNAMRAYIDAQDRWLYHILPIQANQTNCTRSTTSILTQIGFTLPRFNITIYDPWSMGQAIVNDRSSSKCPGDGILKEKPGE